MSLGERVRMQGRMGNRLTVGARQHGGKRFLIFGFEILVAEPTSSSRLRGRIARMITTHAAPHKANNPSP